MYVVNFKSSLQGARGIILITWNTCAGGLGSIFSANGPLSTEQGVASLLQWM